jgi:hypothetical protein
VADIDTILRESLHRLAEPGDPTGVAKAIRARLEAGGSGPSSSSSGGAPARGLGLGGAAPWLPWATLALALSVAGAAAGFSGTFGRPQSQNSAVAGSVASGVHASGCPGGAAVEDLRPGTRVLAVSRDEKGSWLGIRDPYALTRTVWLPRGAVVVDAGQPAIETLQVGGCPVPSVEPSPSPSPTETATAPEATSEPTSIASATVGSTATPKPVDKVPPSISAGPWAVSPVFGNGWSCGSSSSKITVTATDNVGVVSVSASTTFPGATVLLKGHSGSSYDFVFQMPTVNPASGTTSVTFTARDAAGNTRAITVSLAVSYCLI